MTIEIRSLAGPGDIDASDTGTIFGLAIPYNRETTIGDIEHGGFRETIAPGSCSKSLREADIVALLNHNSGQPLGRTSAGNLMLKNTTRGVEPELTPVDTSYARDLAELVKAKVIRGWSFGFEVVKDAWTDDEGKESDCWVGTNRTIREMRLIEVSPVTFPAYDMTSISARDAVTAARDARGGKPAETKEEKRARKAAARAERDASIDAETEAERKKMSAGTQKRIPQIVVELGQALKLFRGADLKSLPDDVQQAVALVSSAATHAGHMQDQEGLDVTDAANKKDDKRAEVPADEQRDDKPKPDDSTSTAALDDNALILATLHVMSRDAIRDQELLSSNESGV